MSASPMARAVETKSIPIKKVLINDPSELPSHYSSTPGGTLYSTTPGGTKIVYERSLLLHLRNSPISKTPPSFDIPEHLTPGSPNKTKNSFNRNSNAGSHKHHHHPPHNANHRLPLPNHQNSSAKNHNRIDDHDEQFQIEL